MRPLKYAWDWSRNKVMATAGHPHPIFHVGLYIRRRGAGINPTPWYWSVSANNRGDKSDPGSSRATQEGWAATPELAVAAAELAVPIVVAGIKSMTATAARMARRENTTMRAAMAKAWTQPEASRV